MRRSFAVVALAIASTTPLSAQSAAEGPKRGTWAAETSFQPEGTLLRFRSATKAWLIRLSASYDRSTLEASAGGVTVIEQDDRLQIDTRLGARFYGDSSKALRPLIGVAAILGITGGDVSAWRAGGAMEAGAAYFFTSHVSLGASGEFSLTRGRTRNSFTSVTSDQSLTSARLGGVRVLGTVYF